MKTIKLDIDRKNTLAIIVSDIDNISYTTANLLCDDIIELNKLHDINKKYNLILLCGHGNYKKLTIGKVKVAEVANRLSKCGYKGQDIYVTSCTASRLNKDKVSIASELKKCLSEKYGEVRVTSDATGATITYKDEASKDIRLLCIDSKAYIFFMMLVENSIKRRLRKSKGLTKRDKLSVEDITAVKKKLVKIATWNGRLGHMRT